MSRIAGWIGFFFFTLSGFLPLISVDVFLTKFSFLSPIILFSETILGGKIFQTILHLSQNLLYVIIFTGIFYFLGVILGFYGLTQGKKQGTFYGGVFGLLYSFFAFVSAYGILKFTEVTSSGLVGAGVGIYSAFFGSILMIYSAQRKR